MLTTTHRRLALAGLVGPVTFVAAWIVGGLIVRGYSSLDYSVSRLAAVGVSYRWVMITGFVVLGTSLLLYAPTLRVALPGLTWVTLAASGIALLGLVAFPLEDTGTVTHNILAAAAYLGIAATPIFGVRPFAQAGMRWAARISAGAGVLAGACLEFTAVLPHGGVYQRIGFTASQAWIAVTAVIIFRRGFLLAGDDLREEATTPRPAR